MNPSDAQAQFRRLLVTAREVQGRLLFLPAVAVGETAAALYARHRISLEVDFVSPYLREKFAEAAHDIPADTPDVDLHRWRALRPEYQDLDRVRSVCEQFALSVIESEGFGERPVGPASL